MFGPDRRWLSMRRTVLPRSVLGGGLSWRAGPEASPGSSKRSTAWGSVAGVRGPDTRGPRGDAEYAPGRHQVQPDVEQGDGVAVAGRVHNRGPFAVGDRGDPGAEHLEGVTIDQDQIGRAH